MTPTLQTIRPEPGETIARTGAGTANGAARALHRRASRVSHAAVLFLAVLALVGGCKRVGLGRTLSPEEIDDAQQRASVAVGAGRYNDAIPDLRMILQARPSDTITRYNLGVALQRVDSNRESVQVLTGWGDRNFERRTIGRRIRVPVDADDDYLYALGSTYQEMREFDHALACFEAALADPPDHLKSRYGRALVLQEMGQRDKARAAWADYLERDPNSAWTDGARKHLARLDAEQTPNP